MPPGIEVVGTDENFNDVVVRSDIPVLVEFWATRCDPHLYMDSVTERIAKKYADRLKVVKLNVDENPKITSKFGISSLPTLMIFKGGKIIRRVVGIQFNNVLIV